MYDYAKSTAPAADGSGGTFEPDLAHNGTYDTRVLSAYSLDIVQQHNMSRGLYLYFAFHAVHVAMNAPLETVLRFPRTPSDARKVTNAMLSDRVASWTSSSRSSIIPVIIAVFISPLPCTSTSRGTR